MASGGWLKILAALFLCHLAAMALVGWLAPELLPDHARWLFALSGG